MTDMSLSATVPQRVTQAYHSNQSNYNQEGSLAAHSVESYHTTDDE